MSALKLYDYWRSSAAYRLRIALNLKDVAYDRNVIDIKPGEDEQLGKAYAALNPQMRVPSIQVGEETSGQSMAILEWLEETQDGPSILPKDPWERLECRAFADVIACDVHPLNNLSVLKTLRKTHGAGDAEIMQWYHDWIRRGFDALEVLASARKPNPFIFGDTPTLAEITLIPQISNARRYDMDLSAYPTLLAVDEACAKLTAFQSAAPEAVR